MSWEAATLRAARVVLGGGLAWYELVAASGARGVARGHAVRAGGGRPAGVRRDPERQAHHRHRAVRRLGARRRCPGSRWARSPALVSNIFFGAGPVDALADDRPGASWACSAACWRACWRGREPQAAPARADLRGGRASATARCSTSTSGRSARAADLASYLAVSATSFPYNLAHAVGNFGFALLIGPAFVRALRRYRRRFERALGAARRGGGASCWRWRLLGGAHRGAQAGAASTPQQRALAYLLKAQNRDGGFGSGAAPVVELALHAAGRRSAWRPPGVNPRDARHPKRDADRLHALARERPERHRRAGAHDPRAARRRALAAQLRRPRPGRAARAQPAPGRLVGAARGPHGVRRVRAARLRLRRRPACAPRCSGSQRQQNRDGGFGFGPAGGSSDVDDTGSVLQALAAGRARTRRPRGAAISYLRHAQNPDGGFGQSKGASSNAQSTAWAVQGLVAVGRRPEALAAQRPQRRSPTSRRSRPRTAACATRAPACRPRCGSPPRPWSRSPASRCRSGRRS